MRATKYAIGSESGWLSGSLRLPVYGLILNED